MKSKRRVIIFILVIAWVASACSGGTSMINSWPSFSVDIQRDSAYVAYNAHIYAVNLDNGAERWRYPQKADAKITFFAPPVLTEDGQLLAGGYDGVLYSLNADNGSELWKVAVAEQRIIASPYVGGDEILVPSADGVLYAVSHQGDLLWKFSDSLHGLWGTPVVNEGRVYLPALDHHVYVLDQSNGQLEWVSEELGGIVVTQPLVAAQGLLIVGTIATQTPELIALSTQEDGAIVWRFSTSAWIWSQPAWYEGILYFGDLSGAVYAIQAEDGKEVWRLKTDEDPKGGIVGTPWVAGDTIYVVTLAGKLFAIDRLSGNVRWNKSFEGKFYQGPVGAGDLLLFSSLGTNSVLIAVDENGNLRWAFEPEK